MDILKEVLQAEERIRPYVHETALLRSAYLSETGKASVRCKLENLQHTGSFKVRGALNKLLSLSLDTMAGGIVAASTGNHGAAVAWSAQTLNVRSLVFVTENTDSSKVEAVMGYGAEVRRHGADCLETEVHAREYAGKHNMTYVPPYNDPQVIGGQGTIGVELSRQTAGIDAVFVSVGGGGLISGIATYLKSVQPGLRVIGCSPENSQVMIQSLKAGRILSLPSLPTLSDGTAGGVEAGSITFDLCRGLVDDYVTVTEDEIAEGLRLFLKAHDMVIEGAAAVAVASYLKIRDRFRGKSVVIVICGANISPGTLKQVLSPQ
ncbi:MAG: threonine/serine dehydratase [Candidatus Eisenbacteria bacterium]